MALDRDQVGLLFQVNADTMDARQQIELFQGVVAGMSAEVRDQFQQLGKTIGGSVTQGLDKAQASVTKFGSALGEASTNQLRGFVGQFGMIGDVASGMIPSLSGASAVILGFAGATAAAGAALAGAAMQAMDYTGQIDDLAQVTNLTTETVQSLRLAATLSGQSFEDVSQSAIIFQKQMEAAKNGNADLAATFKALGVDLTGPVDAAFRQTLEKLGQVADGSTKTATTLELFGKSGSKLLPVMDQVGGSFDGLVGRARELGIVLDEEAIAKSNELADRIDVLKLRLGALVTDIGIGAITVFDDWSTAIGRVSITMRQLFTDTSTIIPNLKKLLAAGIFASMPGGSPINLGKLFASDNAPAGYSGPGIDETTGLPTLKLPAKTKPTTGGTATKAKEEKLVNLPSGDGIKRAYQAYQAMILAEDQAVEKERERLRIAMIDGEEARLQDRLIQQDQAIERARAAAVAGSTTARSAVLAQAVANLETERGLITAKLDELQIARDAKLEADAAKEVEIYRAAQEKKLDDYADALNREEEIRQAAAARRQAALEADPSSPFNIFGAAGQKAADQGAGIFSQLGASASEALSGVSQQMGNFGTMMTDAFSSVAGGLQNMIQGFILTGRIGGAAFKQLAASIISSVAAQAGVKAIFEVAEGFAAAARYDAVSAAQHFTSAKFYGVVAGVAAAAAIGMSAIGPGGGGGDGGRFLAGDRGNGGSRTVEQGGRRTAEPQVIIIRAETEPGVMVSKVVQDYRQNGEMRQALRRDLLGEF